MCDPQYPAWGSSYYPGYQYQDFAYQNFTNFGSGFPIENNGNKVPNDPNGLISQGPFESGLQNLDSNSKNLGSNDLSSGSFGFQGLLGSKSNAPEPIGSALLAPGSTGPQESQNWSRIPNFQNFPNLPNFTSETLGSSSQHFESSNFNFQEKFEFGVYPGHQNQIQNQENMGGKIGGKMENFEWMKPKRQRNSNSKKPATFSRYQQMELEREYLAENYLKPSAKENIAKRLDITENQVKTWYQNRRQKEKRVQKEKKRYSAGSNRSSTTPESN